MKGQERKEGRYKKMRDTDRKKRRKEEEKRNTKKGKKIEK